MSYERLQPNVTMINDLPSLEDLEGVGNSNHDHDSRKDARIQKHSRLTRRLNSESGMETAEQYIPQEMVMQEPVPPPAKMHHENQFNPMSINCLDIARHVEGCPICSRFYNNDKTVYIIAIVILSIVCLLLLKRVLNV